MFERTNNIEEILSSLDGIERAEAPPFLYTRIQARLSSPRRGVFEILKHLISKPAITIFFLFLIFFMDIIVYRATLNVTPAESETSGEDIFVTDDYEEMRLYEIPDNEYISRY